MKRKSLSQREPNGKPKRSTDELMLSPVEVQRLRALAAQGLRDAVWGSMLGYLLITGKITNVQFAAGKRWSEIVGEYERTMQSPSQPRSPQAERSTQGISSIELARDVAVRLDFNAAYSALMLSGLNNRHAVIRVCERNDAPHGLSDLLALRAGLDVLSSHWERPRKKRGVPVNDA